MIAPEARRTGVASALVHTLSCDVDLSAASGARWLDAVRRYCPPQVDPWIWVAPDTDDAPAMVGWGEQARFTAHGHGAAEKAFTAYSSWAAEHPDAAPVAFGSFPFSRDADGFLVVPAVLLVRRHLGESTVVFGADSPQLHRRDGDLPVIDTLLLDLDADQWRHAVTTATTRLSQDSELEKVVLSRSVSVRASAPMDRGLVAARLSGKFSGCWTYCHDGLVGATPELLVDCRDGLFRCRVLAGTRKPSWSHELLHDPKEHREHELAVASVTGRLAEAGLSEPAVRGPFLLELPNVTHLATDITARVTTTNAAHIVDVIHPTAAVCGTPRELAYQLIEQTETIDRGRFAGPVGWMSPDGSGQWALALRCGQFSPDNQSVRVHAGAGIMPSSDPDKEWIETRAKMEAFTSVLEG
ncbi:chorismate-binding protein [Cutibacterium equinum]|uniref:Chorismate-binding protein n=1 Tax=Cutibacterium equinum TaxID=3016342 RepID=A0ABY7R087_9ACTN|nr:chorismate-binding protein [Cutibacterium equinum]WCC80656.1 chorismate-binding protein [Cutibacterium equinum]